MRDSSVDEHQEEHDPRRGAHPERAASSPASYSTSLATFAHRDRRRVKRIKHNARARNSSSGPRQRGEKREQPPHLRTFQRRSFLQMD